MKTLIVASSKGDDIQKYANGLEDFQLKRKSKTVMKI
jgi:hypothetical protein